jgi:SAM-dependent methyltransferase
MRKIAASVLVLVLLGAIALAAASPRVRTEAKRRSKWVVVASNVFQDSLRRAGFRDDQIDQDDGERRTDADVAPALTRIGRTFSNYVERLPTESRAVAGKRVLEVGPGDNAGVALRFVAAGAQRVVALDKFVPFRATRFHGALYRALRDERPPAERRAVDEAIDLTSGVRVRPPRLEWISGVGVEEPHASLASGSFDLIVSNAVLEEVYAIDEAFAAMDRLLAPGGFQVHKIDLRDYGMFSRHGYHPLEFLTIPDGLYRYMVESTGQPNRQLVDYYRRKAVELDYDARILATSLLGGPGELQPPRERLCPCPELPIASTMIGEVRPRLLERYRRLPDEDLMVQGILLIMRKRA